MPMMIKCAVHLSAAAAAVAARAPFFICEKENAAHAHIHTETQIGNKDPLGEESEIRGFKHFPKPVTQSIVRRSICGGRFISGFEFCDGFSRRFAERFEHIDC